MGNKIDNKSKLETFILKYNNNSKWMEDNYNHFSKFDKEPKTSIDSNIKNDKFEEYFYDDNNNSSKNEIEINSFIQSNNDNNSNLGSFSSKSSTIYTFINEKKLLNYNNTPTLPINNKRISEIILLRSHQSGSYCCKGFLDSISICQNINTYYQLITGVRILDLRPGIYKNTSFIYKNTFKYEENLIHDIYCGHGPHVGEKITETFNHIKQFLNQNKKEFIIVELQKACGLGESNYYMNEEHSKALIKYITKEFSDIMITKDDILKVSKNIMTDLTYEEIVNLLGKNIIFIINTNNMHKEVFKNEEEAENSGFFKNSRYFLGSWANTTDPIVAIENADKFTEKRNVNKFLDHTLQLTPSLKELLKDNPFDLHLRLFDKVKDDENFTFNWIVKNINENKANIIGLDFVTIFPAIFQMLTLKNMNLFRITLNNEFLISENFKSKSKKIGNYSRYIETTYISKLNYDNLTDNYMKLQKICDFSDNEDLKDFKELQKIKGLYLIKNCNNFLYMFASIKLTELSNVANLINIYNSQQMDLDFEDFIIIFDVIYFEYSSNFDYNKQSLKSIIVDNNLLIPIVFNVDFPLISIFNNFVELYLDGNKMKLIYKFDSLIKYIQKKDILGEILKDSISKNLLKLNVSNENKNNNFPPRYDVLEKYSFSRIKNIKLIF